MEGPNEARGASCFQQDTNPCQKAAPHKLDSNQEAGLVSSAVGRIIPGQTLLPFVVNGSFTAGFNGRIV